jgi:cytochrome c oxidase subunit 3|tara:strand:+ start:2129 stop:2824 length:696 start_codon:yes stop_codon:yes gene_type:complete
MNIFQKLAEKPWLANHISPINSNYAASIELQSNQRWPAKTALYFFLAVVTVIFMLFTITFLSRSQSSDFQALAGEPWLPFSQANELWLNTSLLLLASVCLQFSQYFSAKHKVHQFLIAVVFSYLFSAAFLFGQYSVWQQLSHNGYYIAGNPANSFFYLLTGIHSLHLLGGVIALLRVMFHFRKDINLSLVNRNLKLCATYWHYLFIVWLFLFALLTRTTETYRAIALFCGF